MYRVGLRHERAIIVGTSAVPTERVTTERYATSEFAGTNEGLDNAANLTEGRYTGVAGLMGATEWQRDWSHV